MAADRSGCKAEEVAEFGGADRTVLQNCAEDPVTGTLVCVSHRNGGDVAALGGGARRPVPGKRHSSSIGHGIHNTIMS